MDRFLVRKFNESKTCTLTRRIKLLQWQIPKSNVYIYRLSSSLNVCFVIAWETYEKIWSKEKHYKNEPIIWNAPTIDNKGSR